MVFITVFAHRAAMDSCVGCVLKESITSNGYVHITKCIGMFIFAFA